MRNRTPKRYFSSTEQLIAIFLSGALALSSGIGYANPSGHQAPAQSTVKHLTAQKFSIPEELGKIEESFSGASGKTIIYIQDAHDSLEAQENIAKTIQYLVAKYGVKRVYEEGYEGPVPTDKYFGTIQDPKIREKVAYFLMDKLRLGGAEYAHITRTKDFRLIGADSLKLHKKNIERYQESARHRKETEKDLAEMDTAIRKLAQQYFTKNLKEWMKIKERFDRQEIELLDYLRRTQTLFLKGIGFEEFGAKYPNISLLLSADKTKDEKLLGKLKAAVSYKALFEEIDQLEDDYSYALTLFSVSRLIGPYVKEDRQFLYLDLARDQFFPFLKEMELQTGLLKLVHGGNVCFAMPFYRSSVFRDSKKIKGYHVVSDLQLYLDLMGFPPVGPEEAEHLISRFKRKSRPFI